MTNIEQGSVYTAPIILGMNSGDVDPLHQATPLVLEKSSLDWRLYDKSLNLFGTAGNPNLVPDWRRERLPGIEEAFAVRGLGGVVRIYNPLKLEWKPEDAKEESLQLARGASIIAPVLDLTSGHGTLAETGFAALAGTLRSQRVNLFIEGGIGFDDNVRRARSLTTLLAEKTLKDFPIGARLAPTFDILIQRGIEDAADFAVRSAGRVIESQEFVIPQRIDLAPTIALVGSGAHRYDGSWYEGMAWQLDNLNVPNNEIYQAFSNDWTMDDALVELHHKTNDAVVLFSVTHSQDSFGALGELGWLITYCSLNSQKLGIYVERHASDAKSDQNRQRTLAMAHLGRLLADFPDLPVFIASSPGELAAFGAIELQKYKQKMLAFAA